MPAHGAAAGAVRLAAQATALTEAERAYGTWTNGNEMKIWMVNIEWKMA